MKMEGYGVDVEEYKAPTPTRKFRAWVEDWELPLLKNNDVIAKVRLIEKYKGLLFMILTTSLCTRCIQRIWNGLAVGVEDGP